MTLHPAELATALQREALRRVLRRSLKDFLDALDEAQQRLTVAQDTLSAAARRQDVTQGQRDALALADTDLRLAAAMVVEAHRRTVEFEKQAEAVARAEAAVANTPWHPAEDV